MLVRGIGLTKVYETRGKKVEVLKGIDFELNGGELVSIVGPSGVGKSTFLHIIGLIDVATSGELYFMEQKVTENEEIRAGLRNQYIGFMFQYHYLLPEFTALENVAMPCMIGGMEEEEAFERAKAILEGLGLGQRLDHRPGELSGGEQQRVALARALVKDPKLVIADEPTGNLDKQTGMGVAQLIKELNKERGVAFIIATHDEELASIADKVYLMKDGYLYSG
ncbi:lipoprotein-releasing system ATP-binding protein [Thermosulfidibacter takaii ABI70S6]|uniref:Lipoprotein-releasing system ATP-binding protein n=1 Tax=Thermosulfidibacter takaii (strain DSM 17441 / JCM 13301 / NBRC 103674 / ABI70S6) TaxID=1298851 RepID=A0A0S3QSC1_THET7|nr:ABC transporter ATP-binding protein [Thermosulfidibacter takaii]BAT71232.1 lipoprotein-releasing system ATP-binding protein [Thermosulfidibacter takaii ABI70S6]